MIVKKKVEVEVPVEISFKDACKVVLSEMRDQQCNEFEEIADYVLLEYEPIGPPVPIVDLMKDEGLAKIKEEFSLEKIEQLYESFRKSN